MPAIGIGGLDVWTMLIKSRQSNSRLFSSHSDSDRFAARGTASRVFCLLADR